MSKKSLAKLAAEARKKQQKIKKHNQKIGKQIDAKYDEMEQVGRLQERLHNSKQSIGTTARCYKRKQASFDNCAIAKNVVIKNRFEGKAAQEIRNRNEQFLGDIKPKVTQATDIAESISGLESYLQEYRYGLECDVVNLRRQLR